MRIRWTWAIVGIITLATGIGMLGIESMHVEAVDYAYYQAFAESVARGRPDLGIPGFHGIDFVTAVVFLLTRSPDAHLWVQAISALLLPLGAFLAARALHGDEWMAVLFAGLIAVMPFASFAHVTGYTQTANNLLFFLTLALAARGSVWTGFPLSLAILTKPFSVIALPAVLLVAPRETSKLKLALVLAVTALLPGAYWMAQKLILGHILIGVHPEVNEITIWSGAEKFARNIVWGVQAIFSIHNFQMGGNTPLESATHTSPVLNLLGVLGLLAPRTFFKERGRLHATLLIGFLGGFALNALVSMNDYYMQFTLFLLVLAALPVLRAFPLTIPIALATLHLSWFYFLAAWGIKGTHLFIYAPLFVADLLLATFGLWHGKSLFKSLKETCRIWKMSA